MLAHDLSRGVIRMVDHFYMPTNEFVGWDNEIDDMPMIKIMGRNNRIDVLISQ